MNNLAVNIILAFVFYLFIAIYISFRTKKSADLSTLTIEKVFFNSECHSKFEEAAYRQILDDNFDYLGCLRYENTINVYFFYKPSLDIACTLSKISYAKYPQLELTFLLKDGTTVDICNHSLMGFSPCPPFKDFYWLPQHKTFPSLYKTALKIRDSKKYALRILPDGCPVLDDLRDYLDREYKVLRQWGHLTEPNKKNIFRPTLKSTFLFTIQFFTPLKWYIQRKLKNATKRKLERLL